MTADRTLHERTLEFLSHVEDTMPHLREEVEHAERCIERCAEMPGGVRDRSMGPPAPRTAAERLAEGAAETVKPTAGAGPLTAEDLKVLRLIVTMAFRGHPAFRPVFQAACAAQDYTPPGCPSGEGPACKAGDAGSNPAPGSLNPKEVMPNDVDPRGEDERPKIVDAAPARSTGSGGKPEPAGLSAGGGGRGSTPEQPIRRGEYPFFDRVLDDLQRRTEDWLTLRRERDEARAEVADLRELYERQVKVAAEYAKYRDEAEAATKRADELGRKCAELASGAVLVETIRERNEARGQLAAAQAACRAALGGEETIGLFALGQVSYVGSFKPISERRDAIEAQLRACLPEGDG